MNPLEILEMGLERDVYRQDYESLSKKIQKVKDLHYPVEVEPSDTICAECSFQLPNGQFFGKVVKYPCTTIELLGVTNE